MKQRILSIISSFLLIIILTVSPALAAAGSDAGIVGEAQELIDDILRYKQEQAGADSVQEWIDTGLTEKAGTSAEWYVLALSQSGAYDFSSYQRALLSYLEQKTVSNASTRQKYAIALLVSGSADSYVTQVMEDSIGQLGIMSWVYGLHLMNNGCRSSQVSEEEVIQTLLDLQLEDGGWSLRGTSAETDVTAMVIQALAPHCEAETSVEAAVEKALELLSSRQLEGGDFASYGVENPESTAQVLTAISALGMDAGADERFIKQGNTLIDGLRKYQLEDGSFSHTVGSGFSESATVQTLYSLVSYVRMAEGKSGLYLFDSQVSEGLPGDEESAAEAEQIPESVSEERTESFGTGDTKDDAASECSMNSVENVYSEDSTNSEENAASEAGNGFGYKGLVSGIIVILAAAACIFFFAAGKRNRKNFLATAVFAALAILFVQLTDFQSADSYYNGGDVKKENPTGTVTMTIRCDTVTGLSDSEYIPADGIVLKETEFVIDSDDTAFDILVEAARKYNIQMENSGAEGMAYIAGINYLYEYDFGEFSGWMYYVNRKAPSVGCDQYVLSDGDVIEWLYSCELGKDLDRKRE